MLKSGREYLDSLKDGRVIYIGDETVVDPTTHPNATPPDLGNSNA